MSKVLHDSNVFAENWQQSQKNHDPSIDPRTASEAYFSSQYFTVSNFRHCQLCVHSCVKIKTWFIKKPKSLLFRIGRACFSASLSVKQKVFQNGLIIKVKSKNIYIYQ
jgi:hypothetical protein